MESFEHPRLRVENLHAGYGRNRDVLQGVTCESRPGSIVGLIGPNGAGKTTTARACAGLLGYFDGRVRAGDIFLDGRPVQGEAAEVLVRRGICAVMGTQNLFRGMRVSENLELAAMVLPRQQRREEIAAVLDWFPWMKKRMEEQAGYLSGGEQQMLAVARGILARPAVLVLDEPSMGMAPMIIEQLFEILSQLIAERDMEVILAEQNASVAMEMSDYLYVIEQGRVVAQGTPSQLASEDKLIEYYLGAL